MKSYEIFLNPTISNEIHSVPRYLEGEYIWSYLARLAYFNGFEGVENFLNMLSPESANSGWRRYLEWRYDADRPVIDFLFDNRKNSIDIIKESTIFTAFQLFETNWYQANKIKSYSCEYEKSSQNKTYIRFPANVEHLNLCPECMKEDYTTDNFHYRKIHQIPGISVCPKHGCSLLSYKGPLGFELEEDCFEEIPRNSISELYAEFCCELLENNRTGSICDTLQAIIIRLSDMYPDLCLEEQYEAITSDAIFKEFKEASLLLKRLLFNSNSLNYLPTESAITLIVLLFRTYECFVRYLPEEKNYKELFNKAIKGKFALVGNYSNDFVRVKCNYCGRTFPSTPTAMIAMEGCPDCNRLRSEQSILMQMLNSVDRGIWINKSPLKSISTKTIFENSETGEIRICAASDIIFNDNITSIAHEDAHRSRYSVSRLPENRKAEYSRLISELTNGEYTVTEQDNPHRFIATNNNKSVMDCSFTRLCKRLLVLMRESEKNLDIRNYRQKLNEALKGNKARLLFPEDFCPSPEYQGNVSKIFSRAVSTGKLERFSNGIYVFPRTKHTLEEVVYNKFFYRYGRYIGVPICASLFSYLENGTLICEKSEFVLIDNGEHKKRDRNIMKINDFSCKASYIQADIDDTNWLEIAVTNTLKHKRFINKLTPKEREMLEKLCDETGIKEKYGTLHQ